MPAKHKGESEQEGREGSQVVTDLIPVKEEGKKYKVD